MIFDSNALVGKKPVTNPKSIVWHFKLKSKEDRNKWLRSFVVCEEEEVKKTIILENIKEESNNESNYSKESKFSIESSLKYEKEVSKDRVITRNRSGDTLEISKEIGRAHV